LEALRVVGGHRVASNLGLGQAQLLVAIPLHVGHVLLDGLQPFLLLLENRQLCVPFIKRVVSLFVCFWVLLNTQLRVRTVHEFAALPVLGAHLFNALQARRAKLVKGRAKEKGRRYR
jgi:hypothetical protein